MAALLHIALKERTNPKSGATTEYLVVNGVPDEDSYGFLAHEKLHATIANKKIWEQLVSLRIGILAQQFESLEGPYDAEDCEDLCDVELNFGPSPESERTIRFFVQPDTELWAKPYSITEYAEAIAQATKGLNLPGVSFYEYDGELITNGFGVECKTTDDGVAIEELDRCAALFKRVYEMAQKLLLAQSRKNSVTTFFKFPPAVSTACEQYLLYFVQFLEDLGVKAEAEIKEGAHGVLFSVTPQDGHSALEKVREALEVYLQLPVSRDFAATAVEYPDMAVAQLQSNILHLHSQLVLAKATLQAKDAAIESLSLSNFQYRQLLSADKDQTAQSEPLIGDVVHVTKIEGKGLKVDLPLFLKRLKRMLGTGK